MLLGILLALVTAVAIGVFVYGIASSQRDYGWLVPIFLARGFSTVFLVAVSLAAENGASPTARRGCWRRSR